MDLAIAAGALGLPSDEDVPGPDPEDIARAQETRVIPPAFSIGKILRYETHLRRLWLQTKHEIEALQAHRRGEPAHLARLDISSPPPD